MVGAKLRRWGFLIVLLILASFAIGYFWMKSSSSPEITAPATPSAATPIEEFFGHGTTESGQEEHRPNPQGISQTTSLTFVKTVHDCAPEIPANDGETVDQWVKQFLAQHPVKSSLIDFENFQLQLPDGSTRRLHLIPSDASGRTNSRELRYFKLDQEGLPERIPLTKEQTSNPSAEFIQSLKNQGTLTSHQIKETKTLQDGSRLSQTLINDHIFEFQLFRDKKTLSCRHMDCQCK